VLIPNLNEDIPAAQSHHDRYAFRVQLLPTKLQSLLSQVTIKGLARVATAMVTNSIDQCKHLYASFQQGITLATGVFW